MSDLIDRQEAIGALEEPRNVSDTWTDEFAVGERMQWEKNVKALNNLPSAEPTWIPVTERLPMKTDEYLVCYNNGDVSTDWYGFTDDGLINGFDEDIVAWMPLPEPYQMEASE